MARCRPFASPALYRSDSLSHPSIGMPAISEASLLSFLVSLLCADSSLAAPARWMPTLLGAADISAPPSSRMYLSWRSFSATSTYCSSKSGFSSWSFSWLTRLASAASRSVTPLRRASSVTCATFSSQASAGEKEGQGDDDLMALWARRRNVSLHMSQAPPSTHPGACGSASPGPPARRAQGLACAA